MTSASHTHSSALSEHKQNNLHNEKQYLKQLMNLMVNESLSTEEAVKEMANSSDAGRGKRKKKAKKYSSDESSDIDEPQINEKKKEKVRRIQKKDQEKNESQVILDKIKKNVSVVSDPSNNSDLAEMSRKLKELEAENETLRRQNRHLERQVLAFDKLPGIVDQLTHLVAGKSVCSSDGPQKFTGVHGVKTPTSSSKFSGQRPRTPVAIEDEAIAKEHQLFDPEVIQRARRTDARKSLYSNDVMSKLSVTGVNSNGRVENAKPAMDKMHLRSIEDLVTKLFPDKGVPDVRFYIREKFNNCAKVLRRLNFKKD